MLGAVCVASDMEDSWDSEKRIARRRERGTPHPGVLCEEFGNG
jgi:hypothetical protein